MRTNLLVVEVCSLILLTACAGPSAESEPITTGNALVSSETQDVFTRHKEFVYLVSRDDSQGQPVVTDTLVLTSSGTSWKSDSTQKGISWGTMAYPKKTGSGVAEGAGGVWIHPPRFDEYAILELSPFPEVKRPFVPGQIWDWKLHVGDHYANSAWAVWKGDMLVKTQYSATKTQVVRTALGQLACQEVLAVSCCAQGISTLRTLFHPTYGFVVLNYRNIDGKRLKLELSRVGINGEFDGNAFFSK